MTKLLLTAALTTSFAAAACVQNAGDDSVAPATSTVESDVTRASDCPDVTPATLAPPATADLAFALDAQGVQKYACVQSTAGYAWTFVAPDANLFNLDPQGWAVHHFAGPTWLARDSSSVRGAKVAASTPDPTAIPWLLLDVASHGGADGRLSDITQIQRLSTTGGVAPATACDADHVGLQSEVLYTARYFFYRTDANARHRVRCGG